MIPLTIRQVLLLKLFKDYDGFNGKINIQKVIYAFQTAKITEFNYDYNTGFFGPFSEELEQDIIYLCEMGLFIEEPYGRIRVKDDLTNKSFFNRFKDFFNLSNKNKILEYRIVDMLEQDLKTSERIELAFSFVYLILNKKIHNKENLFSAIERWKPGDFDDEDKKDVWNILINKNIINEKGEIKIPIKNNGSSRNDLESFVYVEDPDLKMSDLSSDPIKFDEMLNMTFNNNEYWGNLINNIKERTESKYWDFKQTLEMWKVNGDLKQLKKIAFCEKVASFANRKGGIIFIGITDKISRQIMGISHIKSKLQSINIILKNWIDNQEDFFYLEEIILKDSNGIKKHCIAIIIAQTRDPVGVKTLNGFYSYPVRLETGLVRENYNKLAKKKEFVSTTNFNFLKLLNK